MASFTEENYLKAIYHLSRSKKGDGVSTNALAGYMDTKASSVTDMLKKLAAKKWINYKKYQGVNLSDIGRQKALQVVRKHRLWEVFLVDKLGFKWDEVHDFAEELEHIGSEELINRLDQFLEHPKFDPHGDPIPNKDGEVFYPKEVLVSDLEAEESGIIIGVKDSSTAFLKYLENNKLVLGTKISLQEVFEYDQSLRLTVDEGLSVVISAQAGKNLFVKKLDE